MRLFGSTREDRPGEDEPLIYAIGDIHGQITMLRAMLERLKELPLRPQDTLVFLGDYVDRGEDSKAVLDTLLALREERPDTIFLRGNHEQLMLDARDGEAPRRGSTPDSFLLTDDTRLWFHNGGEDTLYSYKDEMDDEEFLKWWEAIPDAHWEFLRATQLEYSTPRYFFVHAGLLPKGKTWEGQGDGRDLRLWIREPFLSSRDDFDGKIVVFGHTPTQRVLVERNKLGIDTGAVFGGPLTAVGVYPYLTRRLPVPRIVQVPHAARSNFDPRESR
jgi:serine/threonine protein phosphatase 1